MKIFYPVEVLYPSQAGGAANSVYWLAKHVSRNGHEVRLVASDRGIADQVELNRWHRTEAGEVIYVKTHSLQLPLAQTVRSIVELCKADVVHLSSIFYPAAFLSAFVARILGKKIAWSPRGELAETALAHSAGRKRPVLWGIRKLIGVYPAFHSTSEEETEAIIRVFGPAARIAMIPNYAELEEQVQRRPGDYLLFMGRLHPVKALDNLIQALPLSRKFMTSGRVLKLAGQGKPQYIQLLKNLVAELGLEQRIEFIGQVEGAEKTHVLADAGVTMLPSHSENFGIVVLESLAQGTPVIASRTTPWQALERESVGIWTENSPEALAAAIDKFLSMEPNEYSACRDRCRKFVERDFDLQSHGDEWMVFYESLV